MPSLFVQCSKNLSVITPNEPVRNALMLGLKVKLIRSRQLDEDVGDLKNNVICDGHGLLLDIKKLACKYNVLDKDFYMLIYKEFSDGFTPHTSLKTSDGLLLHAFTL